MPDQSPDGELVPTRRSLISRLRRWDDHESWRDFFNTYWKLIYSVAIKAGLSDQEAEDAVQETVISVAKKMGEFKYDPTVCSFKGWLMRVTRFRIIDQMRKRQPARDPQRFIRPDFDYEKALEQVADPSSLDLESTWDAEWRKNLVDVAMQRVKHRVNAAHYQIFYWYAVKGVRATEVARMTGTNLPQVYIVKQRVSRLVKDEIQKLEQKEL
jgi:RNA polymerase sigma factor (sigma-70 family)